MKVPWFKTEYTTQGLKLKNCICLINNQFQKTKQMETTEHLSLVKGEKVHLQDKDGNKLTQAYFGAGWDISGKADSYDLDIYAICLGTEGKLASTMAHSVLYFGNKALPGMAHGGDNLTGAGDGDDENIVIDLAALPANVDSVLIGINIYEAEHKHQNFGQVHNAFIRFADKANIDTTIKKFDLSEDYSAFNNIKMGRVYRKDGEWKFEAIGEGTNGSIDAIAHTYA